MKIKPNRYYKRIFAPEDAYGIYSINYTNDTHAYVYFTIGSNNKKTAIKNNLDIRCWGTIKEFEDKIERRNINIKEISYEEFLAEML